MTQTRATGPTLVGQPQPPVADRDEGSDLIEAYNTRPDFGAEPVLGAKLDADAIAGLRLRQKEFIEASIREGLLTLVGAESSDLDPAFDYAALLMDVRKQITAILAETDLQMAIAILNGFNSRIHAMDLDSKKKLFLEWLLGICFAELNVMINLELIGEIFAGKSEELAPIKAKFKAGKEGFLERVVAVEEVVHALGKLIDGHYKDIEGQFWVDVVEAYETKPKLKSAAQRIASLRGRLLSDELSPLIQVLHEGSFAGNGEYLDEIDEFPRLALQPDMIDALLDRMEEEQYDVLGRWARVNFPSGERLKGLHLGRGDEAVVDQVPVDWDRGGINANKLAGDTGDAYYIDLHRTWEVLPEMRDTYDLCHFSMALSGIMDRWEGQIKVAKALANAVQMTKVGGVIACTDHGEDAYLKSPIMPFSVAEPVGSIPTDIYTRISYNDVAVPSRAVNGMMLYKVPLRRPDLQRSVPDKYAVLQLCVFEIFEVSQTDLRLLEQARISDKPLENTNKILARLTLAKLSDNHFDYLSQNHRYEERREPSDGTGPLPLTPEIDLEPFQSSLSKILLNTASNAEGIYEALGGNDFDVHDQTKEPSKLSNILKAMISDRNKNSIAIEWSREDEREVCRLYVFPTLGLASLSKMSLDEAKQKAIWVYTMKFDKEGGLESNKLELTELGQNARPARN